jgi:hypothetical protein
VAWKCGLLYLFFKKLPKENNPPIGENSPNLVTLVGSAFPVLEVIVKLSKN